MEETTIIGYGVLLAVLLFAACGYYCWSESQKSAMVAEALRVAAERRKGAVAPAEDDGDEKEQRLLLAVLVRRLRLPPPFWGGA